jgi:hypothetical protein
MDNNDARAAFCQFSKHGYTDDDREPWEVVCTPRSKPKTRQRKMTVARALKQATKAGV